MEGRFSFNTAIAATMELLNAATYAHSEGGASRQAVREALTTLAQLLFPFAPHVAAEVYWTFTGKRVWDQPWPTADPALLASDDVEVQVQLNGKTRSIITVPAGSDDATLRDAAEADARVAAHLAGAEVRRVVIVPDKLVNFVVAAAK